MTTEQRLREFRAWLRRQPVMDIDSVGWWRLADAAEFDDIDFDAAMGVVESLTAELRAEADAMETYLGGNL